MALNMPIFSKYGSISVFKVNRLYFSEKSWVYIKNEHKVQKVPTYSLPPPVLLASLNSAYRMNSCLNLLSVSPSHGR